MKLKLLVSQIKNLQPRRNMLTRAFSAAPKPLTKPNYSWINNYQSVQKNNYAIQSGYINKNTQLGNGKPLPKPVIKHKIFFNDQTNLTTSFATRSRYGPKGQKNAKISNELMNDKKNQEPHNGQHVANLEELLELDPRKHFIETTNPKERKYVKDKQEILQNIDDTNMAQYKKNDIKSVKVVDKNSHE